MKMPTVLGLAVSGKLQQDKLTFLPLVMHKSILELNCSAFLTYSLFNRIGPRWVFHTIHCSDQPFNLSSKLCPADETYVQACKISPISPLDAECHSRGMTRLQLYQEIKVQWQQEGKHGLSDLPERKRRQSFALLCDTLHYINKS